MTRKRFFKIIGPIMPGLIGSIILLAFFMNNESKVDGVILLGSWLVVTLCWAAWKILPNGF